MAHEKLGDIQSGSYAHMPNAWDLDMIRVRVQVGRRADRQSLTLGSGFGQSVSQSDLSCYVT